MLSTHLNHLITICSCKQSRKMQPCFGNLLENAWVGVLTKLNTWMLLSKARSVVPSISWKWDRIIRPSLVQKGQLHCGPYGRWIYYFSAYSPSPLRKVGLSRQRVMEWRWLSKAREGGWFALVRGFPTYAKAPPHPGQSRVSLLSERAYIWTWSLTGVPRFFCIT